ncbi:MAG: VWA domain-containing protein [Phycisphaerales bacterium]
MLLDGLRWLSPGWLWLLWAALGIGALALLAVGARRRAAIAFAPGAMREYVVRSGASWKRTLRVALSVGALALLTLSLARPALGEKARTVTRTGRDVVFVLDVSRSMLAQDLAPDRLDRAKLMIRDALGVIEGDRVGLVAFAGTASVRCPLTYDHSFFRLALDELSPRSVSRGGTMIGDALRVTLNTLFSEETTEGRTRDIILITDGEDQGSFPLEAAQQAGERGVRIIALGLGSATGAPVPAASARGPNYMRYDGEVVRSRLDSRTLEEMVNATPGGVYLEVGTGVLDLDDVYSQLVKGADQREMDSREDVAMIERFQWVLLPAIGLLLLETLIGERRRG